MIQVVWQFVVKERALGQFERAYGSRGEWNRLFAGYPGFRGTTLLRDASNPRRYLTIDCWETVDHRQQMLIRARGEYSELDAAFADWTESEAELGIFNVLPDGGDAAGAQRKA